jgi:anti-sigma factor RsiW
MSGCRPEAVTGSVDGALDAAESASVAAHLETCAACREQAQAEQELRGRLRQLPPLEPRPGFEAEVRASLRERRWRVLLPLAASLVVAALWLRESPAAVARALVFDHVKCSRHERPPAKVFSSDPTAVEAWFARQGAAVPKLPSQASGLQLLGGRDCPLLDGSSVAHVYYREGERRASVFLSPRPLRFDADYSTTALGRKVRLIGHGAQTLGVVGEDAADVEALSKALLTRSASAVGTQR